MARRIASRLLGSIGAVLGASLISFLFLRMIPSDPARLILGQFATQESVDSLTQSLGLNDPLWVQYKNYLADFFTGDWGFAYSVGQPVTSLMGARLPASIELGLYAFVFAFVGAVVLACLATYRHRPVIDSGVRGLASFGLGVPPFFLGLVLLLLFSEQVEIFPGPEGRLGAGTEPPPELTRLYTVDALLAGQWATFADAFMHLVLPAITLGLAPLAFLTRLLRANLLDISREPFILVARGKGVSRPLAFVRHALPNAFLPTLAASGLLVGQVVAGSVLVEAVFNWPGVGALVVDAIVKEDYAPVQAFVLLSAAVYVVANLIVDILSGFVDPRVRVSRAG